MTQLFTANSQSKQFKRMADVDMQGSIYDVIGDRVVDRTLDTHKKFKEVLNLGFFSPSNITTLTRGIYVENITYALPVELCKGPADLPFGGDVPPPFQPKSFNLIISNLMLPILNNVPEWFERANRMLKPGGMLIASTLGNNSFNEIKQVWREIEQADYPRTIPLSDIKAHGDLLQKYGFEQPVVDSDIITLTYSSFDKMVEDLYANACINIHPNKLKGLLSKRKWAKFKETYENNFTREDGKLTLTLEVIYITGWKRDNSVKINIS